ITSRAATDEDISSADAHDGALRANGAMYLAVRLRPVAGRAVGVVAPALGGVVALLKGAALLPAGGERREAAPARDSERCRAARDAFETADLRAGCTGAQLAVVIESPAVRRAAHGEAARMDRTHADRGQGRTEGRRRRRELAGLRTFAHLTVRPVAPAVRRAAHREA